MADGRLGLNAVLVEFAEPVSTKKSATADAAVSIDIVAAALTEGIELVDMPGINSFIEANTIEAEIARQTKDGAIFILNVHQPMSAAELEDYSDGR